MALIDGLVASHCRSAAWIAGPQCCYFSQLLYTFASYRGRTTLDRYHREQSRKSSPFICSPLIRDLSCRSCICPTVRAQKAWSHLRRPTCSLCALPTPGYAETNSCIDSVQSQLRHARTNETRHSRPSNCMHANAQAIFLHHRDETRELTGRTNVLSLAASAPLQRVRILT